jgi:superfamily II DNA or RNA helicase
MTARNMTVTTVVRRDPDKAYIDTWLWIPRSYINVEGTKNSLTFLQSDKYTGDTKALLLYEEAPYHLKVPRAFWDASGLPFDVIDCRPQHYEKIDFVSRVQLDHRMRESAGGRETLQPTGDNVQTLSFNAMSHAMGGILQLACGKGKTPTALHFIAEQKMPALVLLDNMQLLEQWKQEAEAFLDVPGGVGLIAGGKKDWNKGLVLATYTSVANWADTMPEEVRRWFGVVVWDEGHHVNAPVFSKTVTCFYGRRYCMTATPERSDGSHVIADVHIGKVLHKDLTQPLTARFIFYFTGLTLDLSDPECDVLDKNKEVHQSKVTSYFGRWKPRLYRIIQDCIDAVQSGRRVLVVGNSVDEVVNLFSIWTFGGNAQLLTDIPYPTPTDVGESLPPNPLDSIAAKRLEKSIRYWWAKGEKMLAAGGDLRGYAKVESTFSELMTSWAGYRVYKKCERLNEKRRKALIQSIINAPSTAGFMVYGVPPDKRQEFVQQRLVTFAITKYGKEGLNAPHLDTILVSSIFSDRSGLQQLMGRITGRPKTGKKKCLVVFYRDDIGPVHGMCRKLEKHLREWPSDEGGPFDFEHVNNPARLKWQKAENLKEAFEQQ